MPIKLVKELQLQLENKLDKLSGNGLIERFISKANSNIESLNEEKAEIQALIENLSAYVDNNVASDIISRYNDRLVFRDAKLAKTQQIADLTVENFETEAPAIDPEFYDEYVLEKEDNIKEIEEINEILSSLINQEEILG